MNDQRALDEEVQRADEARSQIIEEDDCEYGSMYNDCVRRGSGACKSCDQNRPSNYTEDDDV